MVSFSRMYDLTVFRKFDHTLDPCQHDVVLRIWLRYKVNSSELEAGYLGFVIGCQYYDRYL